MNKDFKQSYISPALVDFTDGWFSKWQFEEYTDVNAPTVFFGMYNQQDVNAFLGHKGPRIIFFGGNDMHEPQLNILKQNINDGKTFSLASPGEFSDTLSKYDIKHKLAYLAVKDYSNLVTQPLGENIYVYLGRPDNRRYDYFMYEEVIRPLMHVFGDDRVHWVTENETLPFDKLVDKYYNNTFCYVKPNNRGGATAMHELAHMGRRTIGKGHTGIDYFTEYSDIQNLVDLIVEESKFIGKVREDVADSVKDLFVKDEWLTLKYWS